MANVIDTVLPAPRVEVYWNLHKLCWSIRHKGRIIAHAGEVTLDNVDWVVQPAGRKRVLRERRKNVHAFARGTLVAYCPVGQVLPEPDRDWLPARYNPYHYTTFVVPHGGHERPLYHSACAWLRYDRIPFVGNVTLREAPTSGFYNPGHPAPSNP